MRLLAYVLVAASVFAQAPGGFRGQILARHAAETPSNLTLVVSNETAPAGGWVQIKVYAAAPRQITAGALSMDFDPAVFGAIADVAVFSATGDAAGYAHVSGRVEEFDRALHVEVRDKCDALGPLAIALFLRKDGTEFLLS